MSLFAEPSMIWLGRCGKESGDCLLILLPAGGFISGENNEEVGSTCSYWGGTKSFIRNAHTIWANYDKEENSITIKCWGDYRPMGRLVRPVIDK